MSMAQHAHKSEKSKPEGGPRKLTWARWGHLVWPASFACHFPNHVADRDVSHHMAQKLPPRLSPTGHARFFCLLRQRQGRRLTTWYPDLARLADVLLDMLITPDLHITIKAMPNS